MIRIKDNRLSEQKKNPQKFCLLALNTNRIGASTQIKHRTKEKQAFVRFFVLKLRVRLYVGVA